MCVSWLPPEALRPDPGSKKGAARRPQGLWADPNRKKRQPKSKMRSAAGHLKEMAGKALAGTATPVEGRRSRGLPYRLVARDGAGRPGLVAAADPPRKAPIAQRSEMHRSKSRKRESIMKKKMREKKNEKKQEKLPLIWQFAEWLRGLLRTSLATAPEVNATATEAHPFDEEREPAAGAATDAASEHAAIAENAAQAPGGDADELEEGCGEVRGRGGEGSRTNIEHWRAVYFSRSRSLYLSIYRSIYLSIYLSI